MPFLPNTGCNEISAITPDFPPQLVSYIEGLLTVFGKYHDKIRKVVGVTGLLVAALTAPELGKLPYWKLETANIAALDSNRGN